MSDPSGRVKVIAAGNMMQPGCCAICGSVGNEDGYADPAIYVEWHGNIYFCPSCSNEIGAVFGAVESYRYDEVVAKLDHAQQLIVSQQADIARLETNIEAYRGLFSPPDLSGDSISNGASDSVVEAESVASLLTNKPVESERVASTKSNQSAKSKRSDDADESASSDFATSLGL